MILETDLTELVAWSEMTDESRHLWGPDDATRIRSLVKDLIDDYLAFAQGYKVEVDQKTLDKIKKIGEQK